MSAWKGTFWKQHQIFNESSLSHQSCCCRVKEVSTHSETPVHSQRGWRTGLKTLFFLSKDPINVLIEVDHSLLSKQKVWLIINVCIFDKLRKKHQQIRLEFTNLLLGWPTRRVRLIFIKSVWLYQFCSVVTYDHKIWVDTERKSNTWMTYIHFCYVSLILHLYTNTADLKPDKQDVTGMPMFSLTAVLH